MKYFLVFFLACVALAAAAPQYLTYPGFVGTVPGTLGARTLVAGPTVLNGYTGYPWAGRYFGPGVFGAPYY